METKKAKNPSILRATMKEDSNGQIRLRVNLDTSVQATLLTNRFNPDTVPDTMKPALLMRATCPIELDEERKAGTHRLSRRLHILKVILIPNAGHDVILDCPDIVSRVVWSFLEKFIH